MPRLSFGEYRPDIDDNLSPYTSTAFNVLPRGDGYGPMPSISVLTSTLPGPCRGYFYARAADGSIVVFAATADRIYRLNNTNFGWVDVSKSGSAYTSVPSNDQWQFVQFNSLVFATQIAAPLQVFNLTSSTEFGDAAGSPPQARYISVVSRFLVLSGIQNAPYRVQWSGLNNVNASTSWDNVTLQSNYQDLPDGGLVRGVGGGESGIILQDAAARRMTYAPGNPIIFQIDRISEEKGIFAPLSLTRSGDRLFWLGTDGLKMAAPGEYPRPIGKDATDRTLFEDLDQTNLQFCIGASDPSATRWFLAYKSKSGQSGLFDRLLCYDWAINRFSLINVRGEYLATLARPGLTLENLDEIAPGALSISGAADNGSGLIRLTVSSTSGLSNGQVKAVSGVSGTTEANGNWVITVVDGTHVDLQGSTYANAYVSGGLVGGSLDDLPFSLDDISASAFTQLSIVSTNHELGFFSGPAMEATVETPEQAISDDGRRVFVSGFRPIGDAPVVYGSLSTRSTLQAAAVQTSESIVNVHGVCPQRRSTRYVRARVRVPAGTSWSIIKAVEPTFVAEGLR